MLAAGYWLYSISETARLREIIKESWRPTFFTIFFGSTFLISPVLLILYPAIVPVVEPYERYIQTGVPLTSNQQIAATGIGMAMGYSFIFLIVGAVFVKSLLLSSSALTFSAWTLNAVWWYIWILLSILLSVVLTIFPSFERRRDGLHFTRAISIDNFASDI